MATPRPWIVTKHDPIMKHEENLWSVASDVPGLTGIRRRMAIVRLSTGDLLFYNAVPLDEATLTEVRSFGRPAHLVIANFAHCIDGVAFRDKLGLKVYGPSIDAKLPQRIKLDGNLADMPPDSAYSIVAVQGCKLGEPLLTVHSGADRSRTTLVFSDVLMNNRDAPGLRGLLFRLAGFTPGPRVAGVFRMMFVNNRAALAAEYDQWIQTPGLVRVMPTHGDVIDGDPVGALKVARATI